MYNPVMGRFLQRDPMGYVDEVNLYQYIHSSPISRKDPSGLVGIDDLALPRALKKGLEEQRKVYDIAMANMASVNLGFIANRGTFSGTMELAGGATESFDVIKFTPADIVTKQCLCDKIVIVQIIANWQDDHAWYAAANVTNLDEQNLFDAFFPEVAYPYDEMNHSGGSQVPWTPGNPFARTTDRPGYTFTFGLHIATWEFHTFAVCVGGAEKGHSYGYLAWGQTLDFNNGRASLTMGAQTDSGPMSSNLHVSVASQKPSAGRITAIGWDQHE